MALCFSIRVGPCSYPSMHSYIIFSFSPESAWTGRRRPPGTAGSHMSFVAPGSSYLPCLQTLIFPDERLGTLPSNLTRAPDLKQMFPSAHAISMELSLSVARNRSNHICIIPQDRYLPGHQRLPRSSCSDIRIFFCHSKSMLVGRR